MKLFNTIAAGVSGTVVEIVPEDEQAVTTGMPLIWIKAGPSERSTCVRQTHVSRRAKDSRAARCMAERFDSF